MQTPSSKNNPEKSEALNKSQKQSASKDQQQLKQIIRDLGLKVTDQRMLILSCLLNGRDHVTAQELFEQASHLDSSVGFATVYRFLRDLSAKNLVTEVRMGGMPARYEWISKKAHHDHLTCSSCGIICEFENEQIEKLQEEIVKSFGYIMTGHLLELSGICPKCQREQDLLPGKSYKKQ